MSMFPVGWQVEPLSDVCSEIVDCLNKTATVVDGPTPYKMIRTTNVKDGRVNLEETRFVDEAVYRKWTRRFKPQRGDVILTREAPLGEVGLLRSDEHVFLGQRTMAYRANPKKLNQRFLYYSLLGPTLQAQIRMYGAGSTVEHMRVPQAESLQIPFPPLATQQKIAAILSTYDDLIANNQRRITLLERMAEDIYREWFVRLRFPGHEDVKVEKGVPQGWNAVCFSAVCTFEKGRNPTELFPAQVDGSLPYLNVETLEKSGGTFAMRAKNAIVCAADDVLMLMDGARSGVVFRGASGIVSSTFALVRTEARLKNVVFEYLKAGKDAIVSNNTGSAIPHANKEFINRMMMFLPCDDALLEQFNKRYQSIFELRQNIEEQISSLKATRDSLLPRLISGKLSVDALDIRFPPGMLESDA
jgi:type I restriction enzyme S subunit